MEPEIPSKQEALERQWLDAAEPAPPRRGNRRVIAAGALLLATLAFGATWWRAGGLAEVGAAKVEASPPKVRPAPARPSPGPQVTVAKPATAIAERRAARAPQPASEPTQDPLGERR